MSMPGENIQNESQEAQKYKVILESIIKEIDARSRESPPEQGWKHLNQSTLNSLDVSALDITIVKESSMGSLFQLADKVISKMGENPNNKKMVEDFKGDLNVYRQINEDNLNQYNDYMIMDRRYNPYLKSWKLV